MVIHAHMEGVVFLMVHYGHTQNMFMRVNYSTLPVKTVQNQLSVA